MGKKKTCCAVCVVILGIILAIPTVWLWTVFTVDYFLGNPSPIRWYKDQLFLREYENYPVKGYVTPESIYEIHVSNYTFGGFNLLTESWTKPVIIRGFFANSTARKWTPQRLIEHYNSVNRSFLVLKNNDYNSGLATTQLDAHWISMQEMVDNVTNGGTNYIQNANFMYPDDLPLYREIDYTRTNFDRLPLLVQIFMGRKLPGESRGSGSILHCAAAPNLFIQLSASKHWILIDPKFTRYLRPTMFNLQVAAFSEVAVLDQQKESPRWARFPRWEGTIHPGDALWIPPWVWHEVHNQASPEWSLALASRYSAYPTLLRKNALFTFLVDLGTKGKPCLPGFRFFCIALHPGFDSDGFVFQTHASVTDEVNQMRVKGQQSSGKDVKVERDFE